MGIPLIVQMLIEFTQEGNGVYAPFIVQKQHSREANV